MLDLLLLIISYPTREVVKEKELTYILGGLHTAGAQLMGPVVFRWRQDGSLALTWVEATFFGPHLAIPATRGRPSLARGTAPSPARAVHLAPSPEEGTGAAGTSEGSRRRRVRA